MASSSIQSFSNVVVAIVAIVTPISTVLGRRYLIKKDKSAKYGIYYAAAASTTATAGILYLIMAPSHLAFNLSFAALLLISGSFQLFWFVPMIKRWGAKWYCTGIIGTLLFMILILLETVYPLTILAELLQAVYIIITAIIVFSRRRASKSLRPHN